MEKNYYIKENINLQFYKTFKVDKLIEISNSNVSEFYLFTCLSMHGVLIFIFIILSVVSFFNLHLLITCKVDPLLICLLAILTIFCEFLALIDSAFCLVLINSQELYMCPAF